MNFIMERPSFDMFLNTSQTTQELLGAIGHTTFSHYHSRPPESSAGVIHIKYTLTYQFKNRKAHTIQIRLYKQYKYSSQHSTTF